MPTEDLSSRPKQVARVLLVLDACATPPAALTLAARLARQLDATLAGLFVEDERLLRVAAWPPSVEVGLCSGDERPLDVAQLDRQLRNLAARSEHRLAAAAAGEQLAFSFRRVRGARLLAALAASAEADLLCLTHGGVAGGALHGRMIPPRAAVAPVYLLFGASPAARRGLLAAWRLAQSEAAPLVLLLERGVAGVDLSATARAALAEIGAQAQLESVAAMGTPLPEVLAGLAGRALILPADCAPGNQPPVLERLIDKLRCPLLLVR